MKTFSSYRVLLLALGLFFGASARAQLTIPLPNITLANASLPSVTVNLNGTLRSGLPTPFLIVGVAGPVSAQWFCMDPLQTIFYAGSGEPAGNSLVYASNNPANYDLWGPGAPGLSLTRVQEIADLFQAYLPQANNSLTLGALQLAVWEVANESNGNPFSLGTGLLRVSSANGTGADAMIAAANVLLASLTSPAVLNRGNVASLDFLIDGTYRRNGSETITLVQDLVGFTPVPEATTYGLAAVGLIAAVVAKRKSRLRTA